MERVSESVRQLYENFPYPSRSHVGKKHLGKYLDWIAPAFGGSGLSFLKGKTVLDVGCGTGEFSTALAMAGAKVKGIDFSSASIKKAREFAKKNNFSVEFECIDLFEFQPQKRFDFVFSLGALHHTESTKQAFEKTVSFCKSNGLVCVGLYNKFGRFRHRLKRVLLKLFAGNCIEKRMALAKKLFFEERMLDTAWFADKYGQAFEHYHSVGEVLHWFKQNDLVFVGARPELNGNLLLLQLKWLFEKRGAFFVLVGRKK